MSKHEPIIDVAPVASASAKAKDAAGTVADAFQAPSFGKKAARQVWRPLPAVFVLGAGIQRDTAGKEWILEMDLAINVPLMTDFND